MSERRLLKCEKCGKPVAYISLKARDFFELKPNLDNVVVSGTCLECQSGSGFYQRNFSAQTQTYRL